MKCLQNLKNISEKIGQTNKEIEEAANELYAELAKIKNKKGELTDSTIISEENADKYGLHKEEEMNLD